MRYITLIILLISSFSYAQEDPVKKDTTQVHYMIIEGDSIMVTEVELDEVLVLPDLNFKTEMTVSVISSYAEKH